MAEVLFEYPATIVAADGQRYRAQACGGEMPDGLWHGWIEFLPIAGSGGGGQVGRPLRSPRETTQPNKTDALYWASGLTPVYLEGALERALNPAVPASSMPRSAPIYSEPAPPASATLVSAPTSVDPFSLYEKSEALLRKELGALAPWRLANILTLYGLSPTPSDELSQLPRATLVELIVAGVKQHVQQEAASPRHL